MIGAMNRYSLLAVRRMAAHPDRDWSASTLSRLTSFLFFAAILFSFACGARAQTSSATSSQDNAGSAAAPVATPPPKKYRVRRPRPSHLAQPVVLVGAGDIAGCKNIE